MPQTTLDESAEKKKLRKAILSAEQRLEKLKSTRYVTKKQIEAFQAQYDETLGELLHVDAELDRVLEKYTSISSNIDDHFTFDEAADFFDTFVAEQQANMARQIPQKNRDRLSLSDQQTIKAIYRRLARLYHPDLHGGSQMMMTCINHAYATGDIDALLRIEGAIAPQTTISTQTHLQMSLALLEKHIRFVTIEISALRNSELYVLQKKLQRKKISIEESLANLAKNVAQSIEKKKSYIQTLKEKVEKRV